jgi:hypothetical protein
MAIFAWRQFGKRNAASFADGLKRGLRELGNLIVIPNVYKVSWSYNQCLQIPHPQGVRDDG